MESRVDAFDQHVGLIIDTGEDDLEKVSTIMLFASPVTTDAVDRIQGALGSLPKSQAKYLPNAVRADGITSDLITLGDDDVQTIVDGYPFEIGAIDDDRPFFWHFTSFSTVITDWSRNFEDNDIAVVTADHVDIRDLHQIPVAREVSELGFDAAAAEKGGFAHFMLKEIHEQPDSLSNAIRGRLDFNLGSAVLSGMGTSPRELAELERIARASSWAIRHLLCDELVDRQARLARGLGASGA